MSKKPATKETVPEIVVPTQNDNPKFPSLSIIRNSIRMQNQINKWVNDLNREWELIWRASEHDFNVESFHTSCDGVSETITIARVRKWKHLPSSQLTQESLELNLSNASIGTNELNESKFDSESQIHGQNLDKKNPPSKDYHIFGGYLKSAWHSQNKWIRDPSAFLFYLEEEITNETENSTEAPTPTQNAKVPVKKDPKSSNTSNTANTTNQASQEVGKRYFPLVPEMAALGSISHGPTFGKGDLYIAPYSNLNKHSTSELGEVYGYDSSTENEVVLVGSKQFVIDEIEVYKAIIHQSST